MNTFDKKAAKTVAEEIQKALKDLGKKLNVEFSAAGGSFSDVEMTLKVKVVPIDKTAVLEKEKTTFEKHAGYYGLDAKDFGREYMFKGEAYTISGFDLGRPKYSIKATRIDGTVVYFPEKQVVKQLHPERIDAEGHVILGSI